MDNISRLNNLTWLPSMMNTSRVSQQITPAQSSASAVSGTASFADFLQRAISDTVESDASSKVTELSMLTGEDLDMHTVPIAEQKAELLLNLTVQIRNKMLESYQEIMRMQV